MLSFFKFQGWKRKNVKIEMERNKASVIPIQNVFSIKRVINQKRFLNFPFFLHDTADNRYFQGYFIIMT